MSLNNSAIKINAGFELGSSQPIDSRLILTKAQMLAMDENIEPSNYLALCKDDGRLYIYNSANTIDVETGKFRPSNTVNIQYTDMPAIASDTIGQIVQYIGETTTTAPIYNKGCWYQAVATPLYAWKDSINDVTVWTNTKTPNILDNVYDDNLDPTANYVTDYLEPANSIILDDGNTYKRDNTQDTATYHWEELTDSKLKNAILGYNFEDGRIWKGSSEDYEELPEEIKNNTNIIFMVYGASDSNWSIIDDDIVSGEKTISSLKAYATFITANTNALVNYYKKSETFSKAEILQMTSKNLQAEIVTSLPSTDISTSTIYLISASSGYDQWMYINGGWVKIGTTNIDLTAYYNKSEVDSLLNDRTPVYKNISNSTNNVGQDVYVDVTNSMQVALVIMREVKNNADTTRKLIPYVGHITAYTTDSTDYPDVRVATYIASACWGASNNAYVRMRIMADSGKEYEANLDQTGTTYDIKETPILEQISNPFTVNSTTVTNASEIVALKQGRVVQFKVRLDTLKEITTSTWAWVTLGTVVDSIKPAIETVLTISDGSIVARTTLARITTNGEVQIWGNEALNSLSSRFSATYFSAS